MKKLRFAALLFAVCILLSSCVGIGDGALFNNFTTSEQEPIEEITLETRGGTVCKLVAYSGEPNEIMDSVMVTGEEAEEIYEYLSDSSNYTNQVDEVAMSHPYIRVTFEGFADTEEYIVCSSDNVDINDPLLASGRTGHLEGSYEKLFGYIEKYGGSKGYFCNISTSEAPEAQIRALGEDVYYMFITLMEGNYRDYTTWDYFTEFATSTYQSLGAHIILSFFGSENMTYVIYSNDMVYKFDSKTDGSELYAPIGSLSGAYNGAKELLESALDRVTDAEKEAHVKLNCLRVEMHGHLSRTFFLSDFADIGGIYIKHMTDDNGYSVLVYFEECTPEELDAKLYTVRQLSVVSNADKIAVIELYEETAFAE